ncbi:hypothetical protein ACFP1Z_22885 [Streptomyces gamaensis]|uniref:Uncharacterized protein n=1 Tax=Streptomyces gamaensis TaxID=1763542 RepID=A0ABW0Z4E0_9ACTN
MKPAEGAGRSALNLLSGQRVTKAYAIVCLLDTGNERSPAEGMEFLLADGRSVLLSCATDWSLEVAEGAWPELPDWCWPAESWAHEEIERIGAPGLDKVVRISGIHNSVGELSGALLEFPSAFLEVRAGAAVTWEITPKPQC